MKGRPPEAERHIGWLIRLVGRIPRVGPPLESLARAVRMFRHQPLVLGLTSFSTIFVHSLFAVGVYFIACGPPGGHPSLADHLVAMPTSAATQVIPVPMGPLEGTPDNFYARVKVAGPPITPGQGFVVALAYRLVTVSDCCFRAALLFPQPPRDGRGHARGGTAGRRKLNTCTAPHCGRIVAWRARQFFLAAAGVPSF